MLSPVQKRTIILAVVFVTCTLLILHHSQQYDSDPFIASGKKALNVLSQKEIIWPAENPIPDTDTIRKLNIEQISELYFSYVNTLQVFCPTKLVYGGVMFGWYTCSVLKRRDSSKSCVAYMITSSDKTVNNDFFKELKEDFQCEKNVLFKSEMEAAQNSPVTKDTSLVSTLKSKASIDYMAIDTGGDEVQLLTWMLTNNLLKNVQQLLVTFHGINADSKESVYEEHLQVLRSLHSEGFRIFHFARNVQCVFKGNSRKTGCYSLYMMREIPVSVPLEMYPQEEIVTLPLETLARNYNGLLVSSSQVYCKNVVRMGKVDDGGWDVCNDREYRPSSPCLVYSFGIANDWSFDDEVSTTYGCEVHSFDPSIGQKDHKRSDKITFHNLGLWGKPAGHRGSWKMKNLKEIIQMLGHTGKTIDIIKMDIETAEWGALPDMLASGVLENVRQLDIELHSSPNPEEALRSKMKSIRGLHDQGFRLFWFHANIKGGNEKRFNVTGRLVSTCYENYFLNTKFTKHLISE